MLEFLIIIVALAAIAEWYSIVNSRKKEEIDYRCFPLVDSAEPGEQFVVNSEIANHSRHYAPILRIEERFPKKLIISKTEDYNFTTGNEHRIFISGVSLNKRQRVRRRLVASIPERGEYTFSNAEFYAGDFLGFSEYEYTMKNDSRIVIYPKRIEVEQFIQSFADAFENIAMRKRLLEDPISVCGYRDYTGREDMRSISWKQSAVRNKLIVKEFDPTWQQAVMVVLDTAFHGEFEFHIKRQEFCFQAARTICEYFEDKNLEYSLVTNAIINEGISSFHSTGGHGREFNRILYGLGYAKNGETCSVEVLLSEVCSGAFKQNSMVFISTHKNSSVIEALSKTKSAFGMEVITVFADEYINEMTENERKKEEIENLQRKTSNESRTLDSLAENSKLRNRKKRKKA